MWGSWLRSRIRAAITKRDRSFGNRSIIGNPDHRHLHASDTSQVWDCLSPSSARLLENDDAFRRVLSKVRAVASSRLTRCEAGMASDAEYGTESSTGTGQGSAWGVGAASAVPQLCSSVSMSIYLSSRPFLHRLGSRSRMWSSLKRSNHDETESRKVKKKLKGKMTGGTSIGEMETQAAGGLGSDGGIGKVEKQGGVVDGKESLKSTLKDDEVDVVEGVGCDYNEGWGSVPKKAVSDGEVGRMRNTLKESGVEISEETPFGEENLRLLLALGANEEQVLLLFGRQKRLLEESCAPRMMESARMFHEFGMDSTVFMHVISSLNKMQRYVVYMWTPSTGLKQLLTYLRDELRITSLEQVVTKMPFLTLSTSRSIKEHVDALIFLGFEADGDFCGKYRRLLSTSPASMKKLVHALRLALGEDVYIKFPLVLTINAESVPNKGANLQSILGTSIKAEDILLRRPAILMCREETVRETWNKFVEIFGEDEVVGCVIRCPEVIRRNWKNWDAKFEYLSRKGFSKDDMMGCISKLSTRCLKKFIRIRVERALGSGRVQEGSPFLSEILTSSPAKFERIFGVNIEDVH